MRAVLWLLCSVSAGLQQSGDGKDNDTSLQYHKHFTPSDADQLRASKLKLNFNIDMTIKEVAFAYDVIKSSISYYQFGSNGVLLMACALGRQYPPKEIRFSDSLSNYDMHNLKQNKCIQHGTDEGNVTSELVNIGPTDHVGFPTDKNSAKYWPLYSGVMGKCKSAEIDAIFVMGRFRVACVAAAFLYHPEAPVYVIDFLRYEKSLIDIAEVVRHSEKLYQIARRPGVSDTSIKRKMQTFANDPN